MDHLAKLIPLFILIGFTLYIIIRMNRSMKLQKDALDRQKTGMGRVDESIKNQVEGLQLAKEQIETTKSILAEMQEIKRFVAEIKKSIDQSKT